MTANSLPTVTTIDLTAIEKVLRMEEGYVLSFNNRTFAHFFGDLGINIDETHPSGSKANRLRTFLRAAEPGLAARVLEALLEQRTAEHGEIDAATLVLIAKYRSVIARLRGCRVAPLPVLKTEVIDLTYVGELAGKTEQRLASSDFEGAITTARTMLEEVLLELERRLAPVPCDYQGDLQRLYKSVAKRLRIDEERKDLDDNFKQVVRGLVQIVNGLAPIRNKMSDGHPRSRKPAPHHARVIVNAANTVATFLVDSYLYQREKGLIPPSPRP